MVACSVPPRIWIVMPAYNEGPVIGETVRGVLSKYPNLVVIDDCSTDNTWQEALAAGATVLRHPVNMGQGAALQTGFSFALSQNPDFVITFDSDGQHQVDDIARLIDQQRQSGVDVVVGSRFLGKTVDMPKFRRFVLQFAVRFMRTSSGIKLTDAHNGLRLLNHKALSAIRLRQNRMAHASEIVSQFAAQNLKVGEAPVTIVYTEYSLAKGQKLSNSFRILAELLAGSLGR
jgi:polyprenyl-phospho-N-acetylgalactosaminyl synthase